MLRLAMMRLCRLIVVASIVLSYLSIQVPQSLGAIDYVTGVYDNTSVVFSLFLTEPSRSVDGWTFQLFVNSDNLFRTGYGAGIDFVAATDDPMDDEYIFVRDTSTSDGPGGWGSVLSSALVTYPNDMTVMIEIPMASPFLSSGFVKFGFEVYLNGCMVDGVSGMRTSMASGGVECVSDNNCQDGLFCTGIETCVDGFCQTTGDPCGGQQCDNALGQCIGCISHADCDDGLFCNGIEWCDANFDCQPGMPPDCHSDNVLCTMNDFCDETLDACNGIPDDAFCADRYACVPFVGCSAIDSEFPIVTALGSHFIGIDPQPRTSIIPVSIFVESPTFPCLGKYVGFPTAVDLDNNGTLDGTMAMLVDDPVDAAHLTPLGWTGKACNNMAPTCLVDADCDNGGQCVPIKRCALSYIPCDTSSACAADETCDPGRLYLTGYEFVPSAKDPITKEITPVIYSFSIESAGYISEAIFVQANVFGDVDVNEVVNATDINIVMNAFRGTYHLPEGVTHNSILPTVDQSGASICTTTMPVRVTTADILMTVKAFQLFSYASIADLSGCAILCP